jgi:hypothetical protein
MSKESVSINRNNFTDVWNSKNDTLDWAIVREALDVINYQNSTYFSGFTWELGVNIERVFEKPWNYPEIFVPVLNNIINGGTPTWEISSDNPHTSCGECAYNHLVNDLLQDDVELLENYRNEEENISASEDVFGFHAQQETDLRRCDCGVILL